MIRVAAFKFDDGRIRVVERSWFKGAPDADKGVFFIERVVAMTTFDSVSMEDARAAAVLALGGGELDA
mgnify:FL=1